MQLSSSDLFFLQLPHEAIDKRKRFIKERRKELEAVTRYIHDVKNVITVGEKPTKDKAAGSFGSEKKPDSSFGAVIGELERRRVGLGKRLTLKEMIRLQKNTKQQCVSQMGLNFMPKGTKAAEIGKTSLIDIMDRDKEKSEPKGPLGTGVC